MNLSIKELNELIYSLGTTATKGMFCDKELNASLLDKLYDELNRKIKTQEAYDEVLSKLEDEGPEFDGAGFTYKDNFRSHFVSNEEADEDEFTDHLLGADLDSPITKESGWITQAMLDYVDKKGAATYTEMENHYKIITGGSNSFTHILQSLRTPYKNRKTQRYLAKEGRPLSNALWVVKVANPSNWVVVDSGYRTFNEAPYGNN